MKGRRQHDPGRGSITARVKRSGETRFLTKTRPFLVLLSFTLILLTACDPPRSSSIVIGAKNFTEQVLLGELLAQQIEAEGEHVQRRFYLAGSYIAHQALISGRIDAYVEYSGTALVSVLKQPLDRNAAHVFATISRIYNQQYQVRVAQSLGFEDTFAIIMRPQDTDRLHLHTLSDLAPFAGQFRLGVGYEFEERPDGLQGMEQTYNLHFAGTPRVMDLGLLYRALGANQVDVLAGNSTDGAIPSLGLRILTDDRHFFPPYQAVPLVREDTLQQHPAVGKALARLANQVSEREMQTMNHAVEGEHRDPSDVIHDFRHSKGL